jgi:hypothetical protein
VSFPQESNNKKRMQMINLNIHEQIITDNRGNKMVVLDYEDFIKLKAKFKSMEESLPEKNQSTLSFRDLRGLALKVPENPKTSLKTEDDIWKDDL